MSEIYLHFIGKGKGTIPGVPARDLTYDEAKQHDLTHLLASGLYVYVPHVPEELKADLGLEEKINQKLSGMNMSFPADPPKRTRRTKKESE